MDLEEKLQFAFDTLKLGEQANVSFEIEELSLILALVKGDNVYTKALETNLLQAFDK